MMRLVLMVVTLISTILHSHCIQYNPDDAHYAQENVVQRDKLESPTAWLLQPIETPESPKDHLDLNLGMPPGFPKKRDNMSFLLSFSLVKTYSVIKLDHLLESGR